MSKANKPKITGEVKKGGGIPPGFEKLQAVSVYAKPSPKAQPVKKIPTKMQGVWYETFNAVNPVELWAFAEGQEPPKLVESGHPIGSWGYKPGTDPKKCAVEDLWFFPPKAKLPKFFTPSGIWCFPVMKRDENALAPEEGGFLHIGNATKNESMDVAGRWRMLYQRPGEDKPPPPKDMKIHVEKPNGHKITLTVQPTETIDDVKDKVRDKTAIPKDEQRLQFKGKPLDDKPTLEDYGIKDGDTLILQPMEIIVKHWKGKKYPLIVEPTTTIDQVKTKLEKQEGIPKEDQRISFAGNPCLDQKTMRDHGIKHKSILVLHPMTIFVQDPKGKKYTLEDVEPTQTIDQIKSKLENQENIPKKSQRLTFGGSPCIDKKNLRDHGIKHKSVLHLEPMQIHVKTPQGKKLTLDVTPNDTIDDIKNRVSQKENIPKEDQRLNFKNKPLKDDKATLDDEGIKHGDTIDMEPMTIYVQDPKGNKYTLENVEPDNTIDQIKSKLERQEKIPKKNQRLTFEGKPCVDRTNLRDHGIKHKSVLHLEPMQIHVQTPQGKKLTLDVNPTDSINDIKNRIKQKENIPKEDQRLNFKNKPLEDDRATLEDEGIQHGDTIDMEPMIIYVQDPKGKKYTLTGVDPNNTIDQIKHKLEEQENIPKKDQRLTFGGKPCIDKNRLRDHGIKHKSVLYLEPMQIHVKTPQGKKLTLDVNPADTINDIKNRVKQEENIPKEDQRLNFRNKPLEDDKATLDDEGIQHGDTIDMEPMTIYVQDPKGKRYTLANVEPEDTIDKIKTKLEKQESIPKKNQLLTFEGKPCIDIRTLRDHGIKHKAVLHLEPMIVYVRTPQGKKLKFDVEPTDTIKKMKTRVEMKEKIPSDEQRMLFENKPLSDDKATLKDKGIKHGDTIDLEPMHVIIKDWTGKKFPVYCEADDNVLSIKEKIEKQEGHPKSIQFLIFGGTFLDDPRTLRSYGIKHKDVINLDRMKIFVRDWKGKTFTLEVDPKEPIENVKKMIEAREGIPVPQQILKFHAQKLETPKDLSDYGVKNKDTLDLSQDIPPPPQSPPPNTYTIQLTPYKSPFDEGFASPTRSKKRDGIRAPTKEQFKERWHTDLATEQTELGMDSVRRQKESQGKKA